MKQNCTGRAALALLLALSLGGCSAAKSAPEPTPEPTPEAVFFVEEAAPAAQPDPAEEQDLTKAEGDALCESYRALIDGVTEGLRDGWQTRTYADLGVSEVFSRSGHEGLGWLTMDLSGDGEDELLFGEDGKDGEPGAIYDIFTVLGGELVHPVCGWEFNHWYLTDKGILVLEDDTGYGVYRSAYGFFNGKLVEGFKAGDRSEYLNLHFQPFLE